MHAFSRGREISILPHYLRIRRQKGRKTLYHFVESLSTEYRFISISDIIRTIEMKSAECAHVPFFPFPIRAFPSQVPSARLSSGRLILCAGRLCARRHRLRFRRRGRNAYTDDGGDRLRDNAGNYVNRGSGTHLFDRQRNDALSKFRRFEDKYSRGIQAYDRRYRP